MILAYSVALISGGSINDYGLDDNDLDDIHKLNYFYFLLID